jgi:cytochrome c biogenesis protein CcmG, thiol:disulfide interchange protein DsbE
MAEKKSRSTNAVNVYASLVLILVGGGLLLFGLAGFVYLLRQDPPTSQPQEFSAVPYKVEFPAPELSLHDMDGNPVSLEGVRGQVVLINNWATWCPPCRAEMPTLESYYQANRNNNFLLVAIDSGETADVVSEFVDQNGLSFQVWLDPGAKALRAFRNNSLPSSYLIDREGIVRLAWTGAISLNMLDKYVTPLLEEQQKWK